MSDPDRLVLDDTAEEAARSIAEALEFLKLEADSFGMLEVSELLESARAKADDFEFPESG